MKYVLLTGGAGFIGSNFIPYFIENNPHYNLVNLDLLTYAGDLNNLKERLKQPTVAITCKKSACWCGLCTPKANTKTTFDTIMKKYLKEVV